jgi:hypothetical protein
MILLHATTLAAFWSGIQAAKSKTKVFVPIPWPAKFRPTPSSVIVIVTGVATPHQPEWRTRSDCVPQRLLSSAHRANCPHRPPHDGFLTYTSLHMGKTQLIEVATTRRKVTSNVFLRTAWSFYSKMNGPGARQARFGVSLGAVCRLRLVVTGFMGSWVHVLVRITAGRCTPPIRGNGASVSLVESKLQSDHIFHGLERWTIYMSSGLTSAGGTLDAYIAIIAYNRFHPVIWSASLWECGSDGDTRNSLCS